MFVAAIFYSFSPLWSLGLAPGVEGEPGSCFRLLGDILWPGDGFWRLLEARRIPVIEVGGGAAEAGGEPRPGKAPESERAGFWTAMIWPPEAERTWHQEIFCETLSETLMETYIIWCLLKRSWWGARVGVRPLRVLVIRVRSIRIRAGGHPRAVPRKNILDFRHEKYFNSIDKMLPVYIIVIVQAPDICILSHSPPWPRTLRLWPRKAAFCNGSNFDLIFIFKWGTLCPSSDQYTTR